MRALLRDALQLVESITSSTRAWPALRSSRSGMSHIVISGGGWTRITDRRPCISYPHARGIGQRSRLDCCPGHDVAGVAAVRGTMWQASGCTTQCWDKWGWLASTSPQHCNARQIIGMAQQSITGFERLVWCGGWCGPRQH